MNQSIHDSSSTLRRLPVALLIVLVSALLLVGCKPALALDDPSKETATSPTTEPTASLETDASEPTSPMDTTEAGLSETEPSTEATTTLETEPQPQIQAPPSEAAPVVALTFDDGPSLEDTNKLLDLLAREHVTATFFVLGSQLATGREGIIQRAYAEGHEIASHGYSHAIMTDIDAAAIRSELDQTSELIEHAIGQAPTLMRPPTGAYNEQVVTIAGEKNLAVVNWSWQSTPEDWNHHDEPDVISSHVIEKAQNGHIILLHDTNKATIASMEAMIAGLKARGFRFMTVSQLLSYGADQAPQPGVVYTQLTMPTN